MEQDTGGTERAHLTVLAVSHSSHAWGAELQLLEAAERLVEEDVEMQLVAPRSSAFVPRWEQAGFRAHPVDLPERTGVRDRASRRVHAPVSLAREASIVMRAARTIARLARSADVIHSHSLWAHPEVALAGRLARRPTVLSLHDMVAPGLGRRLVQLSAKAATATVANSEATAAAVGGSSQPRVEVIYPSVDLSLFEPGDADPAVRAELSAHPTRPLVGIIGRVDPRKGVHVLVEAMAQLPAPFDEACLVVVGAALLGAGGYDESLRADAARRLGDRVRFTGARQDVPAVLRALDVLVNASVAEPFGRSVLEGQATAVPVVAAAAGGIPEFVDDGRTGLLFPSGDARALRDALVRVLGDAGLRDRLGAAGRAQAEAAFSLEDHARAFAAVYRRVAGGPSATPADHSFA